MPLILVILSIIVISFLIYMFIEASTLRVRKIKFSNKEDALKLMHITDVHIEKMVISKDKIRKIILSESPDAIILSGDYIERLSSVDKFLKFLDYITGICPIYAVFGNHDYKTYDYDIDRLNALKEAIENKGVTFLLDESIIINSYNLLGIKDFKRGYPNIEKALNSLDKNLKTVAFSHNPDILTILPEKSVDYMFCGHYHGGQIRLPFNMEFLTLRNDILCKKEIRRGGKNIKGIELYISNGIGNVLVPMRFLSPPEILIYYV